VALLEDGRRRDRAGSQNHAPAASRQATELDRLEQGVRDVGWAADTLCVEPEFEHAELAVHLPVRGHPYHAVPPRRDDPATLREPMLPGWCQFLPSKKPLEICVREPGRSTAKQTRLNPRREVVGIIGHRTP